MGDNKSNQFKYYDSTTARMAQESKDEQVFVIARMQRIANYIYEKKNCQDYN